MTIRKATVNDAEAIASNLFLAMKENIYEKTGSTDDALAKRFLLHFAERKNNQYSYENCTVVEDEGMIVGAVNIYDGARFKALCKPVQEYAQLHFNREPNSEYETEEGEYYLDSIGVSPGQQGKGIGNKLLSYVVEEYVKKNGETLGLLVEEENLVAKKLYKKVGFKPVGKKTLLGKEMGHLQIRP